MFLGPRAEIQAAWLPDTGVNHAGTKDGLHFSGYISKTTQSSSRTLKWHVRHERYRWTSFLSFSAPSNPQHSPPPNGTQVTTACEPHNLILGKENSVGTHPFFHRSKGSWALNQELWRWPWKSTNRIMPLLRVSHVLVITAAPAILIPPNSCLICVRLGFQVLK